jgi:nuclear transport factor 2 (NTF2) superfamily protein
MKKKLSERIAERAKSKQQSRNAKNRAQFLHVRDEIQEALDDKWTIKDIWGTLHIEGTITFSYEAFRKHVNAWQNPSKSPTQDNQNAKINKIDDKKNQAAETQSKKSTELPGFIHNPIPNKEDLY